MQPATHDITDVKLFGRRVYCNCKVDSLKVQTLPKLPIITKNGTNKSCSELNFSQKGQWAHILISSSSLPPSPLLKLWDSKDCHDSNIASAHI